MDVRGTLARIAECSNLRDGGVLYGKKGCSRRQRLTLTRWLPQNGGVVARGRLLLEKGSEEAGDIPLLREKVALIKLLEGGGRTSENMGGNLTGIR